MPIKRLFSSSISSSYGFSSSSASLNLFKIGSILKQARHLQMLIFLGILELTHDANPLHFDAECAKNAGFSDRLVPGDACCFLYFPGLLLPTLRGQIMKIGEEIIAEVQAASIRQIKNKYIAKLSTKCIKRDGALVIDGEATAMLPSLRNHLTWRTSSCCNTLACQRKHSIAARV
ncbi:hypothetical protein HAX54_036102 [Datura stramonium]|uniref:MaoC-like domain-containing protein n=1 Tax=Datura stramonium TaxID=4076 RepID=A0ABS8VJ18_DATST|nr:hypothetical protein [Datura stramonium]